MIVRELIKQLMDLPMDARVITELGFTGESGSREAFTVALVKVREEPWTGFLEVYDSSGYYTDGTTYDGYPVEQVVNIGR